jgi:hypothetical protein
MKFVLIVLGIWFVIAVAVVATGSLARLPVPPPAILVSLAAVTIIAGLASPGARAAIGALDLRVLMAVHLVRFVGIVFLVLVRRGELTPAFEPIGWGDAIAATLAVPLILANPSLRGGPGRWSVLLWNAVGFADMLVLIMTAIRFGLTAPEEFALFLRLPFGLLPTFFVPLIIATHVFIFVRLFSTRERSTIRHA